jgi:indolepyruvate ferredoxin oxidoreductase
VVRRAAGVGVSGIAAPARGEAPHGAVADRQMSASLDEMIARRVAFLTDYQDAAYAARYRTLVERVREAEKHKTPGLAGLAHAVARYAFKLMAYKDEYEVARLHTQPEFLAQLEHTFDGSYTIKFNLAPPLFARKDADGHLIKREYGPWMLRAFRLLAKLKRLRGSAFDPFGRSAERKGERALITRYERTVESLIEGLNSDNHALAVELASIPEQIRGFGHVKEAHLARANARWDELEQAWRRPVAAARAVA